MFNLKANTVFLPYETIVDRTKYFSTHQPFSKFAFSAFKCTVTILLSVIIFSINALFSK